MSVEQNEFDTNRHERVYALPDRLNVDYEIAEHPAMFSAADNELHERDINATQARPALEGVKIAKNLFLRNKDKSCYYLCSPPTLC